MVNSRILYTDEILSMVNKEKCRNSDPRTRVRIKTNVVDRKNKYDSLSKSAKKIKIV